MNEIRKHGQQKVKIGNACEITGMTNHLMAPLRAHGAQGGEHNV